MNLSNQQQEQIYRRLNSLVGPGSAAFYQDACRLMEMEPPLESTTHLVGHLLREIESSLRAVLMPISTPLLDGRKNNGDQKQKAEIQAVLKLLEISEISTEAETWLSLPGRDNEYGLHKRAHRKALERPRPIDSEFQEFWQKMQVVLDGILDKFEAKYSKVYKLLDDLLVKADPNDEDIKILCNKIPNSFVTLNYFFERLSFSKWLAKLKEKGFFKNPLEPEFDTDTGRILFWQWPQSCYLARMASQEPVIVLEIALEILETGTKNAFVHEDLAEAALAMPPALAARWVEQEIEWLKEQDYLYFRLPEKLGKLIVYLGNNHQLDAAIRLVRELLNVQPNPQSNGLLLGIRKRCDDYRYKKILTEYIPKLVTVATNETFQLLCNLLNDTIVFSQIPRLPGTFEDYSYNWYPSFESNQPNVPYDVRNFLATAVWETIEQIARNPPEQLSPLLQVIDGYHWRIFHRIRLNLLRRFPNQFPDMIAQALADKPRLNESILYCHEYALLLRERFADIGSEVQETILSWIAEGPTNQLEVCEEDRTGYVKQWQRDRLGILSGSLSSEWQLQYEQLVTELGSPAPLEAVRGTGVWQGPTSPKSAEELSFMTISELFDFLREWEPSGRLFTPSRAGLSMELSKTIAQNPEFFVSEIEQFKEVDLQYRGGFLNGLTHALSTHGQRQAFSWLQPLEFCAWILTQKSEILGSRDQVTDWHQRWNYICDEVVTLIKSGLQPIGVNEIPIEFCNLVWTILEQLTDDHSVTPGFEAHYRYSNATNAEAAVNTVRGKAMHAVFQYALWINQHTKADKNLEEQAELSFDKIPEVREVFERHLNPAHDPSVTIRSVYGAWFPQLINLDSNWTTRNLNRIFPRDEVFQDLWDAAWEGYITFWYAPNSIIFVILRKEYNHAIEQIGAATPESQNPSRTDEALAAHLPYLYWNGDLELGDSDMLLEKFFAKASGQHHEQFMRQIGKQLRDGNSEVEVDLLQRLKRLWEWRVSQVKNATASNLQALDLRYFSWWFASGKFDSNWAIAQLKDVIRLVKDIDYDDQLLPHLVALAPLMPLSVVECLSLMADELRSEDWSFSCYQEDSRTILLTALQSGHEASHRLAEDLINRLLARGIADFRDLLTNMDN